MSDHTEQSSAAPRAPRRRRRWVIASIVAVVLVALLVVAYFVADAALRSHAEERIEGEVRDRLPSEMSGAVEVRLGGGSFLLQYLSGAFDRVELDGRSLAIDGTPVGVSAVATGVPVDQGEPIDSLVGTLRLNEDGVNELVAGSADLPAEIRLGDGEIGYAGSFRVLGFDLEYEVTAEPRIDGDTVVLTPTNARLTNAPLGLDLRDVLGNNLSSLAVPVCVAEHLPLGMALTGLEVSTERVDATFEANDLVLSEQSLTSRGSCSNN